MAAASIGASLVPISTTSARVITRCRRRLTMPDQTWVSQNTRIEIMMERPTNLTEASELHWTAIRVVTRRDPYTAGV